MTETIAIFAGPSLPTAFRPHDPRFDWRPPATAGDVLALIDRPPARLCLIDGYFDSCPAPWHKELLLLMARGTLVFGAASVGALRAAELDRFGMIGIGAIYRAYRDGRLHGDDEVALVHAPGQIGWAPLTVPMVEVRATLVAACRTGVINPRVARQIRALARDIHFDRRDWRTIEARCVAADVAFPGIPALHVQLKRIDALACLDAARAMPAPPPITLSTPYTCFISELASPTAMEGAPPRRNASSIPSNTRPPTEGGRG